MAVAIIIPTWNRAELLKCALDNLKRQTYPIERVIVMDNGSTDDSARIAAEAGAHVISLGRNLGFAAAVNRGIREAHGAEYVGILNNDVTLPPGWLACLMARLETGQAWFATGKLMDAAVRDRIDGTFDAVSKGGCAWRCGHGCRDSTLWNEPRAIQMAPLTACVFRAALFERVGLLDETFESYLEDVDLGLRCAELGCAGWYVPEAVAYHQGSATLGRWHSDTVRKIARNQVLLVAKHYPKNWVSRYGWSVLIAQSLWGFMALRHGAFLSYCAGKLEGLRQFGRARGQFGANGKDCAHFPAIIEQSENEIRTIQQLTGFDLYWRLYFALT